MFEKFQFSFKANIALTQLVLVGRVPAFSASLVKRLNAVTSFGNRFLSEL